MPGNLSLPQAGIREAVKALRKGQLVIMPTDTVYGVAADPRVPGAEERLCGAKGREPSKPIPLLAAGLADVERYGAILDEAERRLIRQFWPGPLTLILRIRCSEHGATGPDEGFRVPDCPVALALLTQVNGVLRVTSANRSGMPPTLTAADAEAALGAAASVIIDGGPTPGGTPSTVARVREGKLRVFREGAIETEQLRAYLHV